jgi:ankyrin repeat protein
MRRTRNDEEQPDLPLQITPAMNPLTRQLAITTKACPEHSRRAVANLLNGKPVLASIDESLEKTQVSNSFVHEKGANMDTKDKLDNTALILALGQGNTEIVKLLREKGAH